MPQIYQQGITAVRIVKLVGNVKLSPFKKKRMKMGVAVVSKELITKEELKTLHPDFGLYH